MKKYGYFDNAEREFVITRPDTPVPWINYLSNGSYSGLISQTAGGFSFYKSPKDSRVTRWRYNALPPDRPGRYVYLRDADSGEYWSPTWQPTASNLEQYECRHGMYYTKISSRFDDIATSILYFIPEQDDLELWRIEIRNLGNKSRHLNIFSFVELCLGHALVDLINQPNDQHFNDVFFHKKGEILYASKRYWVTYSGPTVRQANQEWDRMVFMASSLPVVGWDGNKNAFIGRWRSEANPEVVEQGRCTNFEVTSGDTVAVLQSDLELKPKDSASFVLMLGVAPKNRYEESVPDIVEKYRIPDNVSNAFTALRHNWQDYLSHIRVETPDEDMNTMLNIWNQYQTSVTFQFSRDASYYHGGLLFGRGYRDSCQDLMGPVIPRPDWAKNRISEMAGFQFKDGSTYHLYFPLTGGGEKTGHTDTPLWLPLAIITYLKETSNSDFLHEQVPFQDGGTATILQHLYSAINYTLVSLSEKHLAKFGPGDWNDTLDYLGRAGRGESVWVTMYLCYILKETISLCAFIRDTERERKYHKAYTKIAAALNEHCWDGEWYIRGTNDQGETIGSRKNREGRIFLNTQTWAVISGIAPSDRALSCMDAVYTHLETPKGPKILDPAYRTIDPNIGLATRCVAGKKENGAVFNHTVSWSILAECILGRGNRAFEIYQKALPNNPVIAIDRYETEPYVYSEYVTSPDHPTFGQASHSWLTGSSVWMLRGAIDYILGFQPTFSGFKIDPCLPESFKHVRLERKFRGKTYKITIDNTTKGVRGEVNIRLENTAIKGIQIDLSNERIKKMLTDVETISIAVKVE